MNEKSLPVELRIDILAIFIIKTNKYIIKSEKEGDHANKM